MLSFSKSWNIHFTAHDILQIDLSKDQCNRRPQNYTKTWIKDRYINLLFFSNFRNFIRDMAIRNIIILILIATTTSSPIDQERHGLRVKRIVGGMVADLNEFPFQVSLRYLDAVHICGGALISKRHVLSAAHCVCELFEEPYDELSVVTGTNSTKKGGEFHTVESVRCHPEYIFGVKDSWTHDLAVITLNDNVTFNSAQMPIDLPISDTSENISVTLSGWGRHNVHGPLSDTLEKVNLTTIINEDCQTYYNNTILSSQLCTLERKGVGACKGDSGSPLTHDNKLVGIFSWTKPCAVGSPDVYTRVYHFLDFIKSAMQ